MLAERMIDLQPWGAEKRLRRLPPNVFVTYTDFKPAKHMTNYNRSSPHSWALIDEQNFINGRYDGTFILPMRNAYTPSVFLRFIKTWCVSKKMRKKLFPQYPLNLTWRGDVRQVVGLRSHVEGRRFHMLVKMVPQDEDDFSEKQPDRGIGPLDAYSGKIL